ncbi:MAG: AAA family ATPase [Candidatus Muiribacteriota bacterium]
MSKKIKILNNINYGYENCEPVIISLTALNKSFMLIGRHGTGKTRLARFLSRGYGEDGFVFYDATKDDLISVAGIPDTNALHNGQLKFAGHNRSIWDKKTIVVDEITRANRENQNLWLEILENRTCFGIKLNYNTLIATANPESYASAFELDEALLDRFYAVIPVPEHQRPDNYDIESIIECTENEINAQTEMKNLFEDIKKANKSLCENGYDEKIKKYTAKVISSLFETFEKESEIYISPRTFGNILPFVIQAVSSYYLVAGDENPLINGAEDALIYSIAAKIQIDPQILKSLHEKFSPLLSDEKISEKEKFIYEFENFKNTDDRLSFLSKNFHKFNSLFMEDEKEKIISDLIEKIENENSKNDLIPVLGMLIKNNYTGDITRQLNGRVKIFIHMKAEKIKEIFNNDENLCQNQQIKDFIEFINEGYFYKNFTSEKLVEIKQLLDLDENNMEELYKFAEQTVLKLTMN